MNIKGVKAIIWDFDGTLLSSFLVNETIMREIAQEFGKAVPSLEVRLKNYHGSLRDTLKGVFLLNDQEIDPVLESFLQKQNILYKKDANKYLFNDALMLAEQAAEKGVLQVIVTNRDHAGRESASPRAIVSSTKLQPYIDSIICGDDTVFRKPDVRVLGEEWLKVNNIKPSELLVVGDQPVDVALAANLGARVLIVERTKEIAHTVSYKDAVVVSTLEGIKLT